MTKQNIYAFIDSQNLNLGIRSEGWKLDFKRFRRFLQDKYKVNKAYLFIGHISGHENLYTFLQEAGYILIFKPTVQYTDHEHRIIKGNVDAELVLHTMIQFNNFDNAIIISGDGDFYCLIEYLDEQNKLMKVLVPNKKYSSLLRKFANQIISIQIFKKNVEEA